jgi:hypothetical protein
MTVADAALSLKNIWWAIWISMFITWGVLVACTAVIVWNIRVYSRRWR